MKANKNNGFIPAQNQHLQFLQIIKVKFRNIFSQLSMNSKENVLEKIQIRNLII